MRLKIKSMIIIKKKGVYYVLLSANKPCVEATCAASYSEYPCVAGDWFHERSSHRITKWPPRLRTHSRRRSADFSTDWSLRKARWPRQKQEEETLQDLYRGGCPVQDRTKPHGGERRRVWFFGHGSRRRANLESETDNDVDPKHKRVALDPKINLQEIDKRGAFSTSFSWN